MATLSLKSSHREQRSIIHLPFSLRRIQYMVISILQDQQYMFGVKSLLMVEKVADELVDVLFRRLMHWSQWSMLNVYVNLDNIYKKLNINVCCLDVIACWTCSLFSFNSRCCSTLASWKENCLAEYCTDWLRSKYNWCHSNDVIIIKIPVYVFR